MTQQPPANSLPQAELRPARRFPWFVLIPLIALIFTFWLGYRSFVLRGVPITIHLQQGHGLHVGDEVRYRGTTVGEVVSIQMEDTGEGLEVRAFLASDAADLARSGARIWVVRPQVGITGVAGLETVVGPRYLAMLPGDGPPQRHFVGLDEPPIVESIEAGDLEVILFSPQRGGLRPGAPVLYRQIKIGSVLSVGLTSDGGSVEARVHIQKPYVELMRPETKFWTASGFSADIRISGVSVSIPSLEALVSGGVAVATPPSAGRRVKNGHRFELAEKPEEEWLEWQPMVAIGSSLLPAGTQTPSPVRAVLQWGGSRWLTSDKTRRAWVLQTSAGLLAPADLFTIDEVDRQDAKLEIGGADVAIDTKRFWEAGGLTLVDLHVTDRTWPITRTRHPDAPEDLLAIGDPAGSPVPLAAARLIPIETPVPNNDTTPSDADSASSGARQQRAADLSRRGPSHSGAPDDREYPLDGLNGSTTWNIDPAASVSWKVDPAVPVDESLHGAVVISRRDGKLVGLLLVEDATARIALWPQTAQP